MDGAGYMNVQMYSDSNNYITYYLPLLNYQHLTNIVV